MILPFPTIQQTSLHRANSFSESCSKLSKAKDWPGLEALARQQIATDPKDANAQAALGFSLLAQNKRAEGKAACVAALKLNPKHLQALFYLGIECAQEGDAKGALATGRQIESINPLAAIQFMRNPSVQHAVAPGADPILVEASQVHVDADALGSIKSYVEDAANGRVAVAILVLTIGMDGVPVHAETLVASPGLLPPQLEKAAMEMKFKPLTVKGLPIQFRFVFDISVNGPSSASQSPGVSHQSLREQKVAMEEAKHNARGGIAVGLPEN